ncbi:hypothetical protein HBI25_177670 [Parastagonospora nodorum]|nr:hypothetical protein HBH46_040170 [Parastagonospora nodorum]KAH5041662.1 hypothetical protein HBI75_043390 [Parastagonospora nodorum]KAH5124371.1 hypothetical protein HBH71_015820 [Parastagonospora nodorum]KAH5552844.1 hypothetical protein HBI25_177670 [Parastagonospora nodorum]KAH5692046.1 hypothetical protein HBI23_003720 [Parastagonospora nodorum]
MAETKTFLTSKLLKLPNELLHEVASRLATTELRIFSHVNHQLYAFVIDYLVRYRHRTVILRLPANILHNIIYQQQDDYQEARRCFAQTSQKLYSTVMSLSIRYDIERNQSSMLNHAATNNHGEPEIFRRILSSTSGGLTCYTPLMRAATNDHVEMLHLLLAAGVAGIKWGLITAMLTGQERSILLLPYPITLEDMHDVLQLTLGTKNIRSYRYLLAHGPENEEVRYFDDYVKKELDEDTHQFAAILLEYGADPDHCHDAELLNQHYTSRYYAAKNTDPRIRNLLLTAKLSTQKRPDRTNPSTKQSKALMEDEKEDDETEPEVPTTQHPQYTVYRLHKYLIQSSFELSLNFRPAQIPAESNYTSNNCSSQWFTNL